MITAFEMFKKMGFDLYDETPTTLIYEYKEARYIYTIFFYLELKKVVITKDYWIDSQAGSLVPMDKREPSLKYCAKYGYWQAETVVDFDVDIHKAIHQVMKEKGWLDV